jgi:hypothetical protein
LTAENITSSQAWWCIPVIPALERLAQEDRESQCQPGIHSEILSQGKNNKIPKRLQVKLKEAPPPQFNFLILILIDKLFIKGKKLIFTSSDEYAAQIHPSCPSPLLYLPGEITGIDHSLEWSISLNLVKKSSPAASPTSACTGMACGLGRCRTGWPGHKFVLLVSSRGW